MANKNPTGAPEIEQYESGMVVGDYVPADEPEEEEAAAAAQEEDEDREESQPVSCATAPVDDSVPPPPPPSQREATPSASGDASAGAVTPPQRIVMGEEHSPAERDLVENLHISYEFSDGIATDRSLSGGSHPQWLLSQRRQDRVEQRPVFNLAAMVGAAGGEAAVSGLAALVHAAPRPAVFQARPPPPPATHCVMTEQQDPLLRGQPLDLSLPGDLHEQLKQSINAEELEAGDGVRILRVSSPRSKMAGLTMLEAAGHCVQQVDHQGLQVLVLASPSRSESPGLDALLEASGHPFGR